MSENKTSRFWIGGILLASAALGTIAGLDKKAGEPDGGRHADPQGIEAPYETGTGMTVPEKEGSHYDGFSYPEEMGLIEECARRAGIDKLYLMAIREAEDGGKGFEYGVIHNEAYNKDDFLTEKETGFLVQRSVA